MVERIPRSSNFKVSVVRHELNEEGYAFYFIHVVCPSGISFNL